MVRDRWVKQPPRTGVVHFVCSLGGLCSVRLLVQRCGEMVPGSVAWLEGTNELLFVVSAGSVTELGAATLAACWQAFVDARVWQWGPPRPGSLPIAFSEYVVADLPDDDVVDLDFRAGRLHGMLSVDHFDAGTAAGLSRAAGEVAEAGWSWVPRVRVQAA